jgi:hypothetical protein
MLPAIQSIGAAVAIGLLIGVAALSLGVRIAFSAAAGFGVFWGVPTVWAAGSWLIAPTRQRREAREALQNERNESRRALHDAAQSLEAERQRGADALALERSQAKQSLDAALVETHSQATNTLEAERASFLQQLGAVQTQLDNAERANAHAQDWKDLVALYDDVGGIVGLARVGEPHGHPSAIERVLDSARWNRLQGRISGDAATALHDLYETGVPAIRRGYSMSRAHHLNRKVPYDPDAIRREMQAGGVLAERAQRALEQSLDSWWTYQRAVPLTSAAREAQTTAIRVTGDDNLIEDNKAVGFDVGIDTVGQRNVSRRNTSVRKPGSGDPGDRVRKS